MRAVRRAAFGGGAARGPRPRSGAGRPALSAARPGGARAPAERAARGVRGRLGAAAEGTLPAGFTTPAGALGADFILSIEGSRMLN